MEAEWTAAVSGCVFVYHVASPVIVKQLKDEDAAYEMLEKPAVEGTKRVLAASHAAVVRRVVLTSSDATVSAGLEDCREFTSADWGNVDKCNFYQRSKLLAEKVARDDAGEVGLELCTVHPVIMLGPLLQSRATSSSGAISSALEGWPPVAFPIVINVCDARDVADVHIRALAAPEGNGGRFVVNSGDVAIPDLSRYLAKEFPEKPVPTWTCPWVLLWVLACINTSYAYLLHRKKGKQFGAPETEALLGRPLRSWDDAALGMAKSLVAFGMVANKPKRCRAISRRNLMLAVVALLVCLVSRAAFRRGWNQ
eukprot:NODE_11561_length_1278_cov_5.802780.p1 GENE.NODE_11561_length_1278_cov_5.802780~~NODE_11561_length_1278_cov_5.802780.p1  ORF type:complete len:310 (+),score=42.84 NODE_11561_length_1278_cov_5.802780:162-1091(+)